VDQGRRLARIKRDRRGVKGRVEPFGVDKGGRGCEGDDLDQSISASLKVGRRYACSLRINNENSVSVEDKVDAPQL
jgi:hypothetical protein